MKYIINNIPPSLNKFAGRSNTWEYRQQKKDWIDLVVVMCRPRPEKPFEKARVTLTYFFKDDIRRDPDNYSGKFILDGLKTAGIIKDDNFNCIELQLRKGGKDKVNPRVEIEVEEM